MSQTQDSIYYLEHAPVPRAIVHMVAPMMLSLFATIMYNITNAFYIGRLDNTAMLAAITLALPIAVVLMALGNLFGAGAGTYVSRLLGENNAQKASYVSSVNFWFSLLTGVIFMAVCLPLLSPLLHLLGARGDTLPYTHDYILVFLLGAPFMIANSALEQSVRAEGASTASMIGMVSSVVLNMILDPILIFGLRMNLIGAALASVLASVASVSWFVYYLHFRSNVQSVSLKDCRPSVEIFANIFKVGISAFLLDAFLVVSVVMFNNIAVAYGDAVMASMGIAQRIEQAAGFIGMSFAMGVVPLLAYAYAAQNYRRLMATLKTTTLYMVGATLGVAAVLTLFRTQIIGLFSIDQAVIALGSAILVAQLTATLFASGATLFTSIFQGCGKGVQSTVMSVMRGIIFIPVLLVANSLFGLTGVIWSITIAEIIACAVGLVMWLALKSSLFERPVLQPELTS
ncbi:MAG: MATE family efflux transporter [Anaerolineae bacterium]